MDVRLHERAPASECKCPCARARVHVPRKVPRKKNGARTDPARLPTTGPATILSVIDAPANAEVPVTLTQWDLGFLRGLYASPANLRAPAQRGAIGDTIARDLQRAGTAGD